jgi:hypothetical protein
VSVRGTCHDRLKRVARCARRPCSRPGMSGSPERGPAIRAC